VTGTRVAVLASSHAALVDRRIKVLLALGGGWEQAGKGRQTAR